MIQFLNEVWEVIAALWNTGVRFARVAIRVVLGVIFVWPFALLGASLTGSSGFTAAVALVPLAAILLLMLAYPLVSGVLAALPQGRRFYLWLVIVLFGEMVIGLYLAVVPVWNNPGLIPVLVLLVVVLGMFLILKRQFVWRRGGWFSTVLALAILSITFTFFFSGGKKETERRARKPDAVQADARVYEFIFNAGEVTDTVETGPGSRHLVLSNQDWILVSALADGTPKEYLMRAGQGSLDGGNIVGPARVRALTDETRLQFKKVW